MTSTTGPAHPHATGAAVYPALFLFIVMKAIKKDLLGTAQDRIKDTNGKDQANGKWETLSTFCKEETGERTVKQTVKKQNVKILRLAGDKDTNFY